MGPASVASKMTARPQRIRFPSPAAWVNVFTARVSVATVLLFFATAKAEVTLSPLFSDHAVLQQSARTRVWGNATPGEEISLQLGPQRRQLTADARGRWLATLDLSGMGAGPFQLIVEGATNKVVSEDVVIGRVWLCSGQSNMERTLARVIIPGQTLEEPADGLLRHFRVERQAAFQPSDAIKGKWIVADQTGMLQFSAVAYYFGKALRASVGGPVGLLNNSWGGATIEAWIGGEALKQDPESEKKAEATIDYVVHYPQLRKKFEEERSAWETRFHRADRRLRPVGDFVGENALREGWSPVAVPGSFSEAGLPASGAIWFRRDFDIPPELVDDYPIFELGPISDYDEVYLNGRKIGGTSPASSASPVGARLYSAPAGGLKAGRATLVVRVFSQRDQGGFAVAPERMRLRTVNLSGSWQAKVEFALPPLTAEEAGLMPAVPRAPAQPQHTPTFLYNGMLHPLLDCALEGILWYQGESNASAAGAYRRLFPLMIVDWRRRFGAGDLPFYFCQLPNHFEKSSSPDAKSPWAEMREAQSAALALPATGEAVLIDVGEEKDMHPRDKASVGERLVRLALAGVYGQAVVANGPIYRSMRTDQGKVHLRFDHTEGGLQARPLPPTYQPQLISPERVPLVRNRPNSPLEGFALCGEDRQWHWADAVIVGDEVVVSSEKVRAPVAVRYAWGNNPTCNLYNGAGLPARPFRTDDFPLPAR